MSTIKTNLPPIEHNTRKYSNEEVIPQHKLSKLAEASFNTITKFEAGDTPSPSVETMNKIANALGFTIDDLMK